MGGFLVGPAIGALGAQRFGGVAFVFVFSGIVAVLAAIPIALRLREADVRTHPSPPGVSTEFARDAQSAGLAAGRIARDAVADDTAVPRSLWNRGLIAAMIINAGGNFAGGTYEVIWSLFLTGLGASLDLVGLTFAMFGLPVLLLSPYAGRLVDRRGSLMFIVVGSILPAAMGLLYPRIPEPIFAVPLILIEATGFALLNPALYAVVAANSPAGRSSTAQGLFGAAGTVGFIVASLIAGVLAKTNIVYPMYVFTAVLTVTLIVGLIVGRGRLNGVGGRSDAAYEPSGV
jgi:MFS family permease